MLINIVSSAILDANLCRIGNIVPTEVSKTRASRYVDLSVESVGVKRIDTPRHNVSVFRSERLLILHTHNSLSWVVGTNL